MPDHTVKAFLTVEARRKTWGDRTDDGKYKVDSLRITKVHKERPAAPADGEIVEVEITFPEGYFDHNTPTVKIHVPDNQPQQPQAVTTAKVKPRSPSAAASVVQR